MTGHKELKCRIYPFGSLSPLRFVVICSFYQGKMLLSFHGKHQSWETQGGHIEAGETPEEAARRELYEESGVIDAEIIPICDYYAWDSEGSSNGRVYAADICKLADMPSFEMSRIGLFDDFPERLTYPLVTPMLFLESGKKLGIRKSRENSEDAPRLLFSIDSKDYEGCTHTYVRNSARSIIIKDNRIAMIHSLKYDYYEFPGGGIEENETPVNAVIRETMEEAGLSVIRESVREYGYVHRIQKSTMYESECFIQDNFYYLCSAEEQRTAQKLDDYEAEEQYTLEYVKPEEAIRKNLMEGHSAKARRMLEREARVLKMLIEEGFFR